MWEDQEEEEEEEEDGLAGQLLSDILATSKYGKLFEKRQDNMVNTFSLHTGAKNGVPRKKEMWAHKGCSLGFCPFCLSCAVSATLGLMVASVLTRLCWLCLTEEDYYEDDEEDDPDALKDPLYQIDLQVRHP